MSLPSDSTVTVVHGRATDAELVAVVLALDAFAAPPAAVVSAAAHPTASSNWRLAARLELLGQAPLCSSHDSRLRVRQSGERPPPGTSPQG